MSAEEPENELAEILVRDDEFSHLVVLVDSIISKVITCPCQLSIEDTTNHTISTSSRLYKVKSPELKIPKFNGNILKWHEFWDQFESSIHSREHISKIDKFNYLKQF